MENLQRVNSAPLLSLFLTFFECLTKMYRLHLKDICGSPLTFRAVKARRDAESAAAAAAAAAAE